ncbi:tRNA (uracil-5-)-methyltransferase [Trypanosoma theileri]|uniref:tRNA (Uracil-5-)-methyltransferase n=1 Tax=Trypanosoma theileri TaxID=67003 RepID=A0A1X0NXG3_9TRYP|nr:tRNA (uracil-5-)-methyltransferase [Trypanosoma theileri]ORC88909.1 tRNA (uracil-5-)-methyltransferase [Trypanosoma theileri]
MSDDGSNVNAETTSKISEGVVLREHSNENLLKFDTHDKYSTTSAMKKLIMKELPPPKTNAPPEPLFNGLLRMGKNPNTPLLFMAFQTPEDSAAAAELLRGMQFRGKKQWREVPVTQRDLQLTHKGASKKRPREEVAAGQSKVSQWEGYSMEEQLTRKKEHCMQVTRVIAPTNVPKEQVFTGIHPSPQQCGYRNHVQLSFGYTESGKPSIGFLKGAMVEGTCAIDSVLEKDIITMHPLAKVVASAVLSVYDEFASPEKGGLEVFDKMKQRGFWRKLQVRHNVLGEVMIDMELDIESIDTTLANLVKERLSSVLQSDTLKEDLRKEYGKDTASVVSAQYHHGTGISTLPPDLPRHTLFGTSTLTEHLSGLQFELSPTSFFQVNTPGMELLLRETVALAELTPSTTLLDLCCGTGTIGITLARYVKRVIGIELVESAVRDAKLNSERNNVNNTTFYCGRVEQLLPDILNALPNEDKKDIVVILDPPRAGVTPTVLKWIRGTPTIRRVVYISCEQKALERDCPALTKPSTKAYRGMPFDVTAAFAVDLFPHTPHVEMVAVLVRREEEEEEEKEKEKEGKENNNTNE